MSHSTRKDGPGWALNVDDVFMGLRPRTAVGRAFATGRPRRRISSTRGSSSSASISSQLTSLGSPSRRSFLPRSTSLGILPIGGLLTLLWSRGVVAHPRYLRLEAASISTKDGTHSSHRGPCRQPRRTRPGDPRVRILEGTQLHPGWPAPRAPTALHARGSRDPVQSQPQADVRGSRGQGKTAEGRPYGGDAETPGPR